MGATGDPRASEVAYCRGRGPTDATGVQRVSSESPQDAMGANKANSKQTNGCLEPSNLMNYV